VTDLLDIDALREEIARRSDLIAESLQHTKSGLDTAVKTMQATTFDLETMKSSLKTKGEDSFAVPTDDHPNDPRRLPGFRPEQVWCAETLRDRFVVSVDGSQIYPEGHLRFACAVVNVGSVSYLYTEPVQYQGISRPRLLVADDLLTSGGGSVQRLLSKEALDLERLKAEVQHASELLETAKPRQSFLFMDGPLIYSFLEPRTEVTKRRVVETLLKLLELCDKKQVFVIGYLAASRSADWVNTLRYTVLCDRIPTGCKECVADCKGIKNVACYPLIGLTDSSIYASILAPGERSSSFTVQRNILGYYKSGSCDYREKISATYVKLAGGEVVRLEFPFYDWMSDEDLERIHSVTLAQSILGFGYPYVLIRAHEKAVITMPEREGFYDVLDRHLTGKFHVPLAESSKRKLKRESII
jgi:hypothetical protein